MSSIGRIALGLGVATILNVVYSFTTTTIPTHIPSKSSSAFNDYTFQIKPTTTSSSSYSNTRRYAIGLGPDQSEGQIKDSSSSEKEEQEEQETKPKIVIPEPDYELTRTSRRSDFDSKCDDWFASLLGSGEDMKLGEVSKVALERIQEKVVLEKLPPLELGKDDDWTPYQQNYLPGTPIYPAFGIEQFGLPIPRRNAEAWRHFDVPGLIGQDYSACPNDVGVEMELTEEEVNDMKEKLKVKGSWIEDEECTGRLIYLNGRFVPSLSKTCLEVQNLNPSDFESVNDTILHCMNHLTDGFTDKLEADVPSGETDFLTSLKELSKPDHNVGEPTSQFAINNQHGTACFVALNSVRAGAVAHVNIPDCEASSPTSSDDDDDEEEEDAEKPKPILVVHAFTANGGCDSASEDQGVTIHPRTLVNVGENAKLSFMQSMVDLDTEESDNHIPKLKNGCTQIYVKSGAKVFHSYLDETGGIVTPGVEAGSVDEEEGVESPREKESKRKELKDTHFESIDVHVTGDDGRYEGTILSLGGNGRSRIAAGSALLRPGSHATLNGFSLAGGAQRTDMRTLIHHIAQGTTSSQTQKNMVGGRATTEFRGRIRVEQSAQQTDSEQLARTILLSDKSKIWAIPSLEIIADDVQCTHGATVSDLSDEELFYLRSRGLDRVTSRNILMYAFVDEVANCVDEAFHGDEENDPNCMKKRVIARLQNLVPQGDRAIKGEFQSV